MPTYILMNILLITITVWSHSPCIQILTFLKITDIESIQRILINIFNFEIVPLKMTTRITINPDKQIILILANLQYIYDVTLIAQSKFPD